MDRVTKRYKNGDAYVSNDDCFDTWSVPKKFEGNAINRLAAYEDTGLTPEEVAMKRDALEEYHREMYPLLKAKTEGRLMILPCKVGDTVYTLIGDCETPYFVDAGIVFAIGIDEDGTMWISARYESGLKYYHTSADIGKTVFLSREAAEAALKGGDTE